MVVHGMGYGVWGTGISVDRKGEKIPSFTLFLCSLLNEKNNFPCLIFRLDKIQPIDHAGDTYSHVDQKDHFWVWQILSSETGVYKYKNESVCLI